jgi:integrase
MAFMTQPTKHPISGVYRLRQAIPAALRDTAERLYGVRAEIMVNLGTREPAEAKRRAPAALAEVQGKLAAIRRAAEAATGSGRPVTERDVQALAGSFYRTRVAEDEDEPGDPERWEAISLSMSSRVEQVSDDPAVAHVVHPAAGHRDAAVELLVSGGYAADKAAVDRLAEAIFHADSRAVDQLHLRAGGDWRPDRNVGLFPPPRSATSAPSAPPPPGATFDDLLRGWAADKGLQVDAKPIDRGVYDRKRTLERLAAFLGHRDASKVTKADAVRWKEAMQAKGSAVATVRNDLSEMSAVWRWAGRNGKASDNPFEGVSPPKERSARGRRRGYTDDEAAAVLTAARGEKGLLRWLPWVCCLTGARLSEVVQSTKADVSQIDGVWALRIHDDGGSAAGRSVKNADSIRTVPLHPALLAEGFLGYVAALPAGSPLFPDSGVDKVFARRAPIAGRKVSRWLRDTVGLADPTLSPNHSWRHWFITAARRVSLNAEIRSAITGHSAKADESAGYGETVGSFVALLAANVAKIRPPLPYMPAADV